MLRDLQPLETSEETKEHPRLRSMHHRDCGKKVHSNSLLAWAFALIAHACAFAFVFGCLSAISVACFALAFVL